jgi:hypothetical protein
MPGFKGNTFQSDLIKYVLGNVSYTPPASFFVALFTQEFDKEEDPVDDTLSLSFEVSGTGYSRIEYPNDATSWTGDDGTRSNVEEITFPQAGALWGTIRSWALMDTSVGGDGSNIIYFGNLTTPKLVDDQDIVKFNAGGIQISEN